MTKLLKRSSENELTPLGPLTSQRHLFKSTLGLYQTVSTIMCHALDIGIKKSYIYMCVVHAFAGP